MSESSKSTARLSPISDGSRLDTRSRATEKELTEADRRPTTKDKIACSFFGPQAAAIAL
jgi:hypothetical protein